jgi:type IV pilus assembly protein PilZ
MTNHDARCFPRLDVTLSVRYRNGTELASAFIDSLSHGGVFIRTSRPLPIGTHVTMEIDVLGEPAPLVVRGQVVWERLIGRADGMDGMGVAFLDEPPEEVRERLRNLLTMKVA